MAVENLVKRDADPGYIIAWKHKYEFQTGKLADKQMTYGEARKLCEELISKNPDKTYWPEKVTKKPEWHIVYQ